MHITGALTVNQPIKTISAVKKYPRAKKSNARGRAIWNDLKHHGDDLIRLGHITKETRSALTRLVLFEHLSPLAGEAGKRYAYIVARFEKYCTEGRRNAKSPSYERAFGSDQELERRQIDGTIADYEASAKKARKEYNKLMNVISAYGSQAKSLLDDLCCSDIEPPTDYRSNISIILNRIAKKFGVTEAPRRRIPRR